MIDGSEKSCQLFRYPSFPTSRLNTIAIEKKLFELTFCTSFGHFEQSNNPLKHVYIYLRAKFIAGTEHERLL